MGNHLRNIYSGFTRHLLSAAVVALPLWASAQTEQMPQQDHTPVNPSAECAPGVEPQVVHGAPSPDALWDIQFRYNTTDTMGRTGMAAVNYINGEFWVSRWASDTIHRFNGTGQFLNTILIPGLTGTRSLASDGTYLYAGTNTGTIYRIDPVTTSLAPPHTTVAGAVGTVRHCSYDPTLDGGLGGFWVGNFNTDIFAVSRTGTILATIPAATHLQTGMYGSAYDSTSTGGPYLWVFAQSAPNNSQIVRLQLPSGTPTIITHDVMSDVGALSSLTSGLAGGLFISDQLVLGQVTLGGLIQGTPDNILFGYELSDPVIASFDAKMDGLRPVEGYTQVPLNQVFPESFDATFSNFGQNTLDTVYVDFVVEFSGSTVFTDTRSVLNLAPNASSNAISNPFTPASGVGTYDVWAIARTGIAQPDSVSGNDTIAFSFQVTDTTFARDNGIPDGGAGYSVNTTSYAYVSTNYNLVNADTVSSIWVKLATPVDGDTTFAVVANTISNVFPDLITALGTPVVIDQGIDEYVLLIPGGLPLTPGTYSFGCYQSVGSSIGLAQSPDIYTADVNYFFVGGWNASGVQTARFIRPNFGNPVAVGNDRGAGVNFVDLYPNPTTGSFALAFREGYSSDAVVTVTNAVGQVVYQQSTETNGKVARIRMDGQPAGMYFVHIDNGTESTTKKLMITK